MSERVVVLGAGYAGCVAVRTLERTLDDADLTWVSEHDYHLMLHEVHRVIGEPAAAEKVTVPVEVIKAPSTRFVRDRVTGLHPGDRQVELASGDSLGYDHVLVALGSDTAFYGIPGVAEHAHTLNGLDDATTINEAVTAAAASATREEPARVVVGGAGLSGVQAAGELAELGDVGRLPVEVTLVEALEEVLPGADPGLQRRVRRLLADHGVEVVTDDPVTAATQMAIEFESGRSIPADVLVWTGGITGRAALAGAGIEHDHQRLYADRTFRTSDERVFAVGDAAVVDLDGGAAPPTAQAAWTGARVAATNVARSIAGRQLERWTFRDRGTLVSVGSAALAHDVRGSPVGTFGGRPAAVLKKLVAARWIATVASRRRALAAWDVL